MSGGQAVRSMTAGRNSAEHPTFGYLDSSRGHMAQNGANQARGRGLAGTGDRARPIRVLEVELSEDLPALDTAAAPGGEPYEQALVLVRLHTHPLGAVELELPGGALSAAALRAGIDESLGHAVRAHLDADAGELRCLEPRNRLLADAPPVTVIIPSRERPERLERCVRSILTCEYPHDRLDVLVVDNAPATTATRELVERLGREAPVRYAREDATGSASARNRGLEVAENEIVLFTDDDTVVDRWWVAEIALAFANAPEAACVSGLLMPAELDSKPQIWFEQYGGFSRGFDRRVFDLRENRPPRDDEPLYPYTAGIFGTGNNFAFRRSKLASIGNFDPALGNGTPALGGVDTEVLARTIINGQMIVYEPRALVWHAHRPDYEGLRRQVYSYGTGLTAYLLKTMMQNPRLVPGFVALVPRGLRFALAGGSEKNEHKGSDYPTELTRLELKGMLYGPLAYAKSRRKYGPHRRVR